MALCNDPGCAIAAGDGVFISGSGTAADPWLINVTDPVSITNLENDVAALQATVALAPDAYVNTTGDTMSAPLDFRAVAQDKVRLYKNVAGDWSYMAFYGPTGTRYGYVGVDPSNVIALGTDSTDLGFNSRGVERARFDANGTLLVGKPVDDAAAAGCGVYRWGNMQTSTNINSWNMTHNKTAGGDAPGQSYEVFMTSGSVIGQIMKATASTVSYLTTSDEDLKENLVPIDDESALLWLRTIEPYFFYYKVTPDIRHVGYSAQRVAALWPNGVSNGIVSPGHGDVNDRTWDENGNETTPPDVWQPWMMDHSKLTPILHSGLQAIDRIVEARTVVLDDHETRIVELEAVAGIGDTGRLEALEAAVTALQGTVADLQATVAAQADRITELEQSDAVGLLRNEVYYTRQMSAAWQYSNTTGTPPTGGQLRSNTPLTNLYINKTDTDGFNRSTALNNIVVSTLHKHDSARFRVRGANGSLFEVRSNAPATDNGTWISVPVTILSGNEGSKGTRVEITLLSEIWAEDPPLLITQLPSAPEPEVTVEPVSGSDE